MESKVLSGQVVDRLHAEAKARGHGAIVSLEDKIGFKRGQLYNLKYIRDCKMSQFFSICSGLDVSPSETFLEALDDFRNEIDRVFRGHGRRPTCVARIDHEGPSLPEHEFRSLEAMRLREPSLALRRISAITGMADNEERCRIYLIAASCLRTSLRYRESIWCLSKAEHLADERIAQQGKVLLLKTALIENLLSAEIAIDLVDKPLAFFAKRGDMPLLGRSLLAKAALLGTVHQYEDFNALLISTETLWDILKPYDRGTLRLEKSIYYLYKGLTQEAASALSREEFFRDFPELAGKRLWALAGLNLADYRIAKTYLRESISLLSTSFPVDAALATVDLVRFEIAHGRNTASRAAALAAFPLLDSLKPLPAARAALEELFKLVPKLLLVPEVEISASLKKTRARLARSRTGIAISLQE